MTDSPIAYHEPHWRLPRLPNPRRWLARKLVRWGLDLEPEDGNLVPYAREELKRAGWFDKDGFYDDMVGHAVVDMIKLFAMEGHSGMSAPLCMNLAKQVGLFQPLTPLTGADDEWTDCGWGDGHFQNKRCSHVFKDADGNAYDIQGRIFREPSGATYTGAGSRVPVTFPYTPTSEIVDVQQEPDNG